MTRAPPAKRAQPARPGRRRGPHPDPRRRRRLHRPRRPGEGPDGRHRAGGRGVRRPAALPLRHQGAALRRGADLLPRGSRACSTSRLLQQRRQRRRRSGSRPSSTGACPATSGSRTSGCSGRSSTCSASGKPELAKVGADLYEDLYATVADIITDGHRGRRLRPPTSTPRIGRRDRGRPLRRARRPGAGQRPQPHPRRRPRHARGHASASSSATTGRSRPRPARLTGGTRMTGPVPSTTRRDASSRADWPLGAVAGLRRLRLHAERDEARRGPAAEVGEGQDRRRPRLLQLGRLPRPRACSRASRRSTASRSSSPTSTRWRACTPRSTPATSTTSSSRSPSGS